MNKDIHDILKLISTNMPFFKGREPSYLKQVSNPKRDWLVVLTLFIFMFFVSAGISCYLYYGITTRRFFTVSLDVVQHPLVINVQLLQQTTHLLDARRTATGLFHDGKMTVPQDPSL